jgi:hypothetical protein
MAEAQATPRSTITKRAHGGDESAGKLPTGAATEQVADAAKTIAALAGTLRGTSKVMGLVHGIGVLGFLAILA